MTPGSQLVNKTSFRRGKLISLLLLITGLRRHCRVVGNSMEPSLYEGDLVIFRPIKSGDNHLKNLIVVFKDPLDPNSLMVKRVFKEKPEGLELRGDNELSSIDSRQFGIVNRKNIIGVVDNVISKD